MVTWSAPQPSGATQATDNAVGDVVTDSGGGGLQPTQLEDGRPPLLVRPPARGDETVDWREHLLVVGLGLRLGLGLGLGVGLGSGLESGSGSGLARAPARRKPPHRPRPPRRPPPGAARVAPRRARGSSPPGCPPRARPRAASARRHPAAAPPADR
eukprot:scaffold115437_cov57-Phaeocystis_antarctica.AAC.2